MSLYSQKLTVKNNKIEISHFITIGDSLSDRGTLFNRFLFHCIPMSKLSGLLGRSPSSRFTNGYTWDDHFISKITNQFIIKDLKKVKLAIKARIKNIEQSIKHDYQHFVLFDLPDLSLTPYYQNKVDQAKDDAARKIAQHELGNAKQCSEIFNAKLKSECEKIEKKYPHCTFKVYETNKIFSAVYDNPEKYNLKRELLKTPFITSDEFKTQVSNDPNFKKTKVSPASGYMFGDDIHPTADMHALLAEDFYKECIKGKYRILDPNHIKEASLSPHL